MPLSAGSPAPPSGAYQGSPSAGGSGYVPQRPAPPPPGGYDQDGPHVVDYAQQQNPGAGAAKRTSYAGAARSSYHPGSRPFANGNGSGGSGGGSSSGSYQPSRPPPAPPTTRVLGGGTPPGQFSSNPSTPTRQPSGNSTSGGGSGLGGAWEIIDDVAPKRSAPPPLTNSLRDISDALPQSSGGGFTSHNSSNSSLIVHPPSNQPPSSNNQYSLLTDPATAAAAGLSLGDDSWSSGPAQQPQPMQMQQPGYRGSNEFSTRVTSPPGPSSGIVSAPSSSRNEKEKRDKGKPAKGIGSFLGTSVCDGPSSFVFVLRRGRSVC